MRPSHSHPFAMSPAVVVSHVRTRTVFVLVAVATVFAGVCHAFNLEPQLPIVKKGIPGSYFGYSVAEHLILDESKKRVVESV